MVIEINHIDTFMLVKGILNLIHDTHSAECYDEIDRLLTQMGNVPATDDSGYFKKEEQERVTFNKYGRFKVKDYWFELRPVFSHNPDYFENIDLKGYMLFVKSKTHGYDEPCSKVIDYTRDIEFERLSDNAHWENIEVPRLVLGLAEDYILDLNKEEDDE